MVIIFFTGTTSNDPRVVAGYFVNTIESVNGVPARVRSDHGTENSSMEQMLIFLRHKEDNPLEKVWLYGTSQHNQRIEAWWSILRKHQSQFWMNLFQHLKEETLFEGSFLEKSLIQFCFMAIIQVIECDYYFGSVIIIISNTPICKK